MTSQKFGGPWSLIKLNTIESYLKPYCRALGNKFDLIYIDAFAGSGSSTFREAHSAPLFDEDERIKNVEGSATRALNCDPPFNRLVFIEQKLRNISALKALAEKYPNREIHIQSGDANEKVAEICDVINWKNTRGIIFLDPFGNSVEWATLKKIAQTKALDVWYLFPLSGVVRQASVKHQKLTDEKRASITKILGTNEWEDHFYSETDVPTDSLFGWSEKDKKRTVTADGIEKYISTRLKTIFPLVAPPIILRGPSNSPLYALYLALSNDSKKAQELAMRISRNA